VISQNFFVICDLPQMFFTLWLASFGHVFTINFLVLRFRTQNPPLLQPVFLKNQWREFGPRFSVPHSHSMLFCLRICVCIGRH